MMDYKEIAAIVKERGDAILAEKAEKTRRIKRISLYASGLAAAAAAAFCIWQNNKVGITPSLDNGNSNVICDITSSVTSPDAMITTVTETASENTSTKPVYQKTTSVQTGSVSAAVTSSAVRTTSEAATSAVKDTASIRSDNTATAAETSFVHVQTTEAVIVYNYETAYNEGRVIMKHLASLSAALLMLPNVTAANSAAENVVAEPSKPFTREPDKYASELSEGIRYCIDNLGMDIDINCDGKIDIFDIYAVDRSQDPDECPDYINEKVAACNKIIEEYNENSIKNIFKEKKYSVDLSDLQFYFIEYYPIKPEYFDPNYYAENCPDTYVETVPLEYIGKEGGIHNVVDFYETMYYRKEGDGYVTLDYLDFTYANDFIHPDCVVPKIYRFIGNSLKYDTQCTTAWYNMLSELIEDGSVDPDINSDGIFDNNDIMLLGFFEKYFYDEYDEPYYGHWDDDDVYHEADSVKLHKERRTYEGFLDYYDSFEFLYPFYYFDNHRLSENEWSKAMKFFDSTILSNYNSYDILETLFTYYIINNKVDFSIFDDDYYRNRPDAYLHFHFRGYLYTYKKIAETYGVNKIREPEEEPVDLRFIRYDIEEMFPEYYAKVKNGELPEPDINKNGKTDIQDYAFFHDIFLEFPAPGDPSYLVYVTIDAPQYVRDAFNNDYDFNNNGVSCDFGELECIELYIAKALGASDYNDIQDMLDEYYAEHPEYDPRLIANELLAQKNEEYENSKKAETASDNEVPENNSNYTETNNLQTYMSSLDLFADVTGDANIDGNTDISDSVLIMQSISNPSRYKLTPQGKKNADSNGDGVTSLDALAIQCRLLGL